jgi:hypothetical protein
MCVVTGACREEARGFMANDINKVAFLAFSLVFIRLTVSLGEQQELVTDALRELHKLLDDDDSGGIDSSESKEVCEQDIPFTS